MGSTSGANPQDRHHVECEDCEFTATGAEAFVRRKGSFHSKGLDHEVTYDDQ